MLNWITSLINRRQKYLYEENARLRKLLRVETDKKEDLEDALVKLVVGCECALSTLEKGTNVVDNGQRQIIPCDLDVGMEYIRHGRGELTEKLQHAQRELKHYRKKEEKE